MTTSPRRAFARTDDAGRLRAAAEDGPDRRTAVQAHWFDRVLRWRDRLVASPRFQRWASSFPPTRRIARRNAGALFDLCAGFVYSQVLAACVRLKLFDRLWDGPLTADVLAGQCDLPPDAMRRLLAAAEALGLVAQRAGGRYGLAMLGAALHGNPGIAAMVEHHAMLYADLRDPVALLRGEHERTELSRYWGYAANESPGGLDDSRVAGYTALMSASQGLIADDILSAYDFSRHRCLLDVGGGDGAFLIAAAARVPALRLKLFDLPAVAKCASARFAASGLAGRAEIHSGSFLSDPLPAGADLITLNRILLDHDDATVLALLRAVRRAIPEDGVLLVAEIMSGIGGSRAVSDAYFGFYLLAMGRGRPRSLDEIRALLGQAGFVRIRPLATRRPLLTNLVAARPG
ncbi:methyltransferase [Rhodomicrobium vannielii]|uniref:methyltransferase n=1 Tax=Rhodomicrobium vannielii TaxID=1069 RepID=UPI003D7C1BDE